MRDSSSAQTRHPFHLLMMVAGTVAFLFVSVVGVAGAGESPTGIQVRTTHQTPIRSAAIAAPPGPATSLASPHGDWPAKNSRDDVEPIDRDEFLGQIEQSLSISGFSERVDPFSGSLHLNMVDLVLPGNAGLDIVIQRYYSSQVWNRVDTLEIARHVASADVSGRLGRNGWQLHMGKLMNAYPGLDQHTTLIMPDGSTHTLYSRDGFPGEKITPEGWVYSVSGSVHTVQTTTGLKYIFDAAAPGADYYYLGLRDPVTPITVIQCTRIEDLNGNAIVIEYSAAAANPDFESRIDRIAFDDVNDPREVVFAYLDDTAILVTMQLKNDGTAIETWTFTYHDPPYAAFQPQFGGNTVFVHPLANVLHSITGDYANERITNPWGFDYYSWVPPDPTPLTEGLLLIKSVVSPRVGKISYTWGPEVMETGSQNCGDVRFLTLQARQSAVAVTPDPIVYEDEATTSYTYTNGGQEGAQTDIVTTDSQTSVVLSTEEHVFHGWGPWVFPPDLNMWKVGLPTSSTIVTKDDAGEDLETTTTTTGWEQGSQISVDTRLSSLWFGCGSSRKSWPQTYVKPTTVTRVVERHDSIPDPPPVPPPDPASYTTVSSLFDDYGNVGKIDESSSDGLERETFFTYWPDPTYNIKVGRIQGQDADPGGTQCYQYDALGRVEHSYTNPQSDEVAICTELGAIGGARQVDYVYHLDGNLHMQTELSTPNNRVTTHTNYVYGKPKETVVTTGIGTDIHYCRDHRPRGMLSWQTDGRGCSDDFKTVYDYDFLGRRTSADPPLADAVTYEYPTQDLSVAFVTRGGRQLEYRFDRIGSGHLTDIYKHIGAAPVITHLFTVTNDALGRRRQVQQLWNTRLGDLFSYDPLRRLTTITHPDVLATQVTIDYAGSDVTVTDENLHETRYFYEAFGNPNDRRLTTLTDAGSFITTYGYDSVFGNLDSVTAPIAQGDRSFTYYSGTTDCNNGFLSGETHPESGTTTYEYNCLGNITSRARPGSETTTYDYDHAGRLTDILYSGTASDVGIEYDQASRRTSLSNDFASATYGHDDAGRLQTVTQSIVGGPQSQVTSYTYDTLDRLETITYPSTRVVTYGWNDDNWLDNVTGPDGSGVEYITSTTHHVTGAIDLVTFGNTPGYAVTTDHGIDDRNRLSSILTSAPGGQLLNVSLGYDAASNLETWDDLLGPNFDRTFGYDSLDRLTSATCANLWGTLGYTYDELGNRLTRTHDGVTTTYVYDTNNRLTDLTGGDVRSFTYDAVGRLETEDRSSAVSRLLKQLPDEIFSDGFESGDTSAWDFATAPTGVFVFTFNAADELVSVTDGTAPTGDYAYDGDGFRVSKDLGSLYYLRDAMGNTLSEYDEDGELIAEYVYANGRQVAKVVPDGAGGYDLRFFHADHLGSALSITDEAGSPVWVGEYLPFGTEFSSAGEPDRYRFTQHELDTETDLLYAKARYYHPVIGRFISTDPVGGSVGSPQSWNRYSYVTNNPLLFIDPTGESETIYLAFRGSGLSDKQRARVLVGVRDRHVNAGVQDVSVYPVNTLTSHKSRGDDVVSNIEITTDNIGSNRFGYTHSKGLRDRKNKATVSTDRAQNLSEDELVVFLVNVVSHETGHTSRAMKEYDFDGLEGSLTGESGTTMEGQIAATPANAKLLGSRTREFSAVDAEKLRNAANPQE